MIFQLAVTHFKLFRQVRPPFAHVDETIPFECTDAPVGSIQWRDAAATLSCLTLMPAEYVIVSEAQRMRGLFMPLVAFVSEA